MNRNPDIFLKLFITHHTINLGQNRVCRVDNAFHPLGVTPRHDGILARGHGGCPHGHLNIRWRADKRRYDFELRVSRERVFVFDAKGETGFVRYELDVIHRPDVNTRQTYSRPNDKAFGI